MYSSEIKVPIYYVNEYRVDRVRGGSEEGGWYYDAGEYLRTAGTFTDKGEATDFAQRLEADARAEKREMGEADRYSVIGTPDVEYFVQTHTGRDFPSEPMHYE